MIERTDFYRCFRLLACLWTFAALLGCTDESVAPPDPDPVGEETPTTPQYSIKAYIGPSQKLIEFGPADSMPTALEGWSWEEVKERELSVAREVDSQGDAPKLREMVLTDGIDTNAEDESLGFASGWSLAIVAAKTCSGRRAGQNGRPHIRVNEEGPWPASLSGVIPHHHHLLYWGQPNCDNMLAAAEVVLCTADRLAEIAESPGTVRWLNEYEVDPADPPETIDISFPPQATDDRFIARDMALNLLANLGQLLLRAPPPDQNNFGEFPTGKACLERYLEAPGPTEPEYYNLFDYYFRGDGKQVFQLEGDSELSDAERARLRVRLIANVMAGAARLTHKLVEDSVRDDLAGAERARATAGDPVEGARLMWGAPDPNDPASVPYYNSVRHAMKVLFGRLELQPRDPALRQWEGFQTGILLDDPACDGALASQLVDTLGSEHSARWRDTPPTTPDQAFALSILESAGIVVPPASLSGSALREPITNQLLLQAAEREGLTLAEFDVDDNPTAGAVREVLSGVSDQALRFAVERNFDGFRLLTGYPQAEDSSWPLADAAGDSGLPTGTLHASLANLGAVVIEGGVPRGDLAGDIMPRLASASAASSCWSYYTLNDPPLAHDMLGYERGWLASHQNAFELGDLFRRQLGTIRDESGDDDVVQFASSAMAAIREWAGPGRLVGYAGEEDGSTVSLSDDRLFITGMTLEELGVKSLEELEQVLVRARGIRPQVTECLVGQRTLCPPISETTNPPDFQRPTSVAFESTAFPHLAGLDDPVIEVNFPPLASLANSDVLTDPSVNYVVAELEAEGPINIMTMAHPTINKGKGKFLGTLRGYRYAQFITSTMVSQLQQRLANEVFGMGRSKRTSRSCLPSANSSTNVPKNYCLEGMERDMFVPLANELTTEGSGFEDSWRHYLRVAKDAAAKTDELGRQLIELGIARDIRQEAALEEVANMCGAFPEVDGVAISDGRVVDTEDDDQTNACINDATFDLVFLSRDPFLNLVDPTGNLAADVYADSEIRRYFCPSDWPDLDWSQYESTPDPTGLEDAPFCGKARADCVMNGGAACITHAGLGFVEEAQLPAIGTAKDLCGGLNAAVNTSGDVNSLDSAAFARVASTSEWARQPTLQGAIGAYRLLAVGASDWVLNLNDEPVLGTTARVGSMDPSVVESVYPACLDLLPEGCNEDALFMRDLMGLDTAESGGVADTALMLALIEDAVQGLGALAGVLPTNAIVRYVPVADTDSLFLAGASRVPAAALYGFGQFEPAPTPGTYNLTLADPTDSAARDYNFSAWDRLAMGSVVDISSDYLVGRSNPDFYDSELALEIENWASSYLMAGAGNARIDYQDDLIDFKGSASLDAEGQPVGFGAGGLRATLPVWYQQFALGDRQAMVNALFHHRPVQESRAGFAQSGVCANQPYGGPAFVKSDDRWEARVHLARFCGTNPVEGLPFGFLALDSGESNQTRFFDWVHHGSFSVDTIPSPYLGAPFGLPLGGPCLTGSWDERYYIGLPGYIEHAELAAGLNPPACMWNAFPVPENDCDNGIGTYTETQYPVAVRHEAYQRLAPRHCSPGERVELFLPKPKTRSISHGLGLGCVAAAGGIRTEVPVPPDNISTPADIARFEGWLSQLSSALAQVAGEMYLVNVPTSAVEHIKEGSVDVAAATQGNHGQLLLDLGEHLRAVQASVVDASLGFDQVRALMRAARLRIEGAQIDLQAQQLALELSSLELERQRAMQDVEDTYANWERAAQHVLIAAETTANAASTAIESFGTASAAHVGVGAAKMALVEIQFQKARAIRGQNLQYNRAMSNVVQRQGENAEQGYDNDVQSALADLSINSLAVYGQIEDAMNALSDGVSNALGILNGLDQNQQSARRALAKASGADFVESNGQLLPLHLNTVYRRQFGVVHERYARALASAKRAAYMARLAVEQRLGVRFGNLHEGLGPLEAPSLWIEDLCSLQGVDYNALRTAFEPGTSTGDQELDLISGFADQYIGDYVDKLEELVEFYNLENPFSEGSDTAIISLREDLPNSGEACTQESPNELFHSDNLTAAAAFSKTVSAPRGWRLSGCDDVRCLKLAGGVALTNGADAEPLLPPEAYGGVSWLRTVPPDEAAPTNGVPPVELGAPANAVYQTVELNGGDRHSLSWWDMARDFDGTEFSGSESVAYRVAVYTSDWSPILLQDLAPNSDPTGTDWAERRSFEFVVPESGEYHVAFSAAVPNGGDASLAIANVQLENNRAGRGSTSYRSIGGNRMELSGDCQVDDPATLRSRFSRRCDSVECFYELNDLLVLDTELLSAGQSPLRGQLALGNFNYRHGGMAVNVVGTGVLDCSESPEQSCFGNGYVEYDLRHAAHDVPLVDYEGRVTCFDFMGANIKNGKALATERFLTLPIGNADRDLISQDAIRKTQLVGRPISGAYRLRIKDSPALAWDQVEDVQLVVDYKFWSRIDGFK